jgi:WD40 repeat protein
MDGLQGMGTSCRRVCLCCSHVPHCNVCLCVSCTCWSRVWDLASGELRASLQGHTGWVSSVAATPDGSTCVSGSGDTTVRYAHYLPSLSASD